LFLSTDSQIRKLVILVIIVHCWKSENVRIDGEVRVFGIVGGTANK
jgi:hypothetical protein